MVTREELTILMEAGLMAARDGDLDKALTVFAGIEVQRPDRSAAFVGAALAFLHSGLPEDALACVDRGLAVAVPEDRAELHAMRGLVLQAAGRRSESVSALRQAGAMPLARKMLGEAPAA